MKKIITHRNIHKDIETLDDFCRIISIEKSFLQKHLRLCPLLYIEIPLKKKDGTPRPIRAPKENLKIIQRAILKNILSDIKLPPCCYGFSKNKSIIENAKIHSKNDYLLNLDIKDFFPSVHYKRVQQIFLNIGLSNEIADILCGLTTYEYRLPQGAPTSPFLASFALSNLDYRLMELAKSNYLTYTRYFDDVSFSGGKRVVVLEKDIIRIIKEEGYVVKIQKTKLFTKNEIKEVNGISIKDKKLFLKNTEELFEYIKDLNENGLCKLKTDNPKKEKESLKGKIAFLKQIDREQADKAEMLFTSIKW
ncbi:MAG: reverse transcriptase family protein [Candidatus Paceibacterota bacterium]